MNCFEYKNGEVLPCQRELVAEEPLRIVINNEPLAALMRTPGSELDLATGFLLTERVIESIGDVGTISFCEEGDFGTRNEVTVTLSASGATPIRLPGQQLIMSSCGICGTDVIESVTDGLSPFENSDGRLRAEDVFRLSEAMHRAQRDFKRTGAAHAAALSELPVNPGNPILVREDLGRHNALDKAVGAGARNGLAFGRGLLFLSGRISFEMVAKAARAGIPSMASVSAPTALAVDLAVKLNMFVAGFVRGRAMTIYSGREALRE